MKLEDIERVLVTLECPLCSTRNFDLKLRCDLGYEHCLPTVRCRQCGHEFDAEWLIRFQDQGHRSLQPILRSAGVPDRR